MIVVLVVTLVRFGPPSLEQFQVSVRKACEKHGSYIGEIQAMHCTHLAGDYWHIWPTVFAMNCLYHEKNLQKSFYGISQRALSTRHCWSDLPEEIIIAGPSDDPTVGHWLNHVGLPDLDPIKTLDSILIYESPSYWRPGTSFHMKMKSFHSQLSAVIQTSSQGIEIMKDCGREGYLLYGPYIYLPKGRYVLDISLQFRRIESQATTLAFVDIANNKGRNVIHKSEITRPADPRQNIVEWTTSFTVTKGSPAWEFRLYYYPLSDLTISGLWLRRVD